MMLLRLSRSTWPKILECHVGGRSSWATLKASLHLVVAPHLRAAAVS